MSAGEFGRAGIEIASEVKGVVYKEQGTLWKLQA